MRKQFINTILLSGLLCGSGLAGIPKSSSVDQVLQCASTRTVLLDVGAWDRNGANFREVPIWLFPNNRTFFFISGMTIDADGAPNAYHPDDIGLDELANAGSPVHWDGIITDEHGNPLIQEDDHPFPGYYVSCTSLEDETKDFADSARYVDATKIPYIALPEDIANHGGARLGDFAFVMNVKNGKSSFAIYADIGTLGEGSIALADALGISSDARRGGQSDAVLYLVFPGSGNLKPRTMEEIQGEGEKLLLHWQQLKQLSDCVKPNVPPVGSGQP